MRVIGRVLFGTLAIVFAMGFIARLVRRRPLGERRQALLSLSPDTALRPAARLVDAESMRTYLAAQPGGSGWGHLVVPPSSPSRALRRKAKRGGKGLARNRRQKRLKRAKVQKTVGAMNYVVWQSPPGPQDVRDESPAFDRARPRHGAGSG